MIDELEAKAKAATPGPWKHRKGFMGDREIYQPRKINGPGIPSEFATVSDMFDNCRNDAAYIASCSPDVMLRLIAVARLAKQVLADLAGPGETTYETEFALRAALKEVE